MVSGAPVTCGMMELTTTSGAAFVICDTGRPLPSTELPRIELTGISVSCDTGTVPSITELMMVSGAPVTCGMIVLTTTLGASVSCDVGRPLPPTMEPTTSGTLVS
jgi:hypothetical protein